MGEKVYLEVSFRRPDTTIPAATEVVLSEDCPLTGVVDTITLHFPDGCNSLVEITCYISQIQVLPISGFIALNNAIKEFRVDRRISTKDKLRVKITNKDSIYEHTPSIIWSLRGIP